MNIEPDLLVYAGVSEADSVVGLGRRDRVFGPAADASLVRVAVVSERVPVTAALRMQHRWVT
ncbi:hypothetical protein ACFO1B_54900 [Dactylosporangium siamense]|nr:hypothetical protein [Dactylosporangium siamense]